MVEEVRQITLSATELMTALENYRDANPQFLPPGAIMDFNTAANGSFTVVIGGSSGTRQAPLQLGDLMEPIIAYCTAKGVPLPWKSRKGIEMRGSNAILKITLDHSSAGKISQQSLMPSSRD